MLPWRSSAGAGVWIGARSDTVRAIVQDRPVVIVLGTLGTAAELAIVLGHQVWSGDGLPIMVTVIGWIILIRGTISLFLSRDATARLVDWFRFEAFFHLYLKFAAIIGLYLTRQVARNALHRRTWRRTRASRRRTGALLDMLKLAAAPAASH